jgi:hypothetical protein
MSKRDYLVSGAVFLEETEDGVVVRTAALAVAHAQALAKRFASGGKPVSVRGFLAHRKTDSGDIQASRLSWQLSGVELPPDSTP